MNAINEITDPYTMDLEDIDPSDPGLLEHDAWRPVFARLRDEAPVHYCKDSIFGPYWSVTRWDDIVAVDSNFKDFSNEPAIVIGDPPEEQFLKQFIAMDPPKHDVQRRAAQPVVAPKNLAQLESLIRSRVVDILDNLPVGEAFNWVDHVSINLTTQMLATLFDFPFEDRTKLTYWSDMATATKEIAGADGDPEERFAALNECLEYFMRLWHERKGDGVESVDLIRLLQRDPNTENMIDDPMEFLGNIILLIVGGNDTTRNSATGGVLALNQNPAEYDKLRADPSLIPSMVSEIIRWQTPLAHMCRTATRDLEFGGQQIREGEKVVMWYLSGNNDERAIERPDEFLIDRANPRKHISFGFGVHRCMGNRLAEMQLRILWEEIMARFKNVEVVGPETRIRSCFVRGYSHLPVVVHPH